MSITRTRLTSGESRGAAIAAARELLIANGPQAVTLKAVAATMGKSHANLLHHFGSAAGLQAALAADLGQRVTEGIARAGLTARHGEDDAREIVARVFDSFGRDGGGALASWMILTGNRDALNPVLEAIQKLVDRMSEGDDVLSHRRSTLSLVLLALGDSLLGGAMAHALSLPRETARELAVGQLQAHLDAEHPG